MTEQSPPTPDPILTTLREREARYMADLAEAKQAQAVAIAAAEARLEEVRDLIGTVTRKRSGRKAKVTEAPTEPEPPASEGEELGL